MRGYGAAEGGERVETSGPGGGRTVLWLGLGTLWLLDGVLQLQPAMFTPRFVQEVLLPAGQGQPAWLASAIALNAAVWRLNPALFNAAAALTQLAIGLLLLFRRERPGGRAALWLSVAWGLGVWVVGEGMGGLLTGSVSMLSGAPGAALIYVVGAALLLLPRRWWSSGLIGAWMLRAVGACWLAMAALQAWPAAGYWTGSQLSGVFTAAATAPQPAALAGPIRQAAALAGAAPLLCNAVVALALAALGTALLLGRRRALVYALAVAWLAMSWWLGQDFGGLFSGLATDPNTSVPFAILLLAAAASSRRPASGEASRPSVGPSWRRDATRQTAA